MCGINHRNTEQVKQAERLDQKVMVQLAVVHCKQRR